jgi:enolase-phosphatase E1
MLVTSGTAGVVEFRDVDHVVVDIEGTTSASAYVFDVLFPYAAERFPAWLDQHAGEAATDRIVTEIAQEAGLVNPSHDEVVATLRAWVAEDRKATPLKELQGLIWQEGFASGELVSDFFPDALVVLRQWHSAGLPISVYSSGSVLAQRNWYTHSPEGNLSSWISGYYDTANAGPKREPSSYRAIAEAIDAEPSHLLFCSDVVAELDAASDAGWQVVRVRRSGEPHAIEDSTYPEVTEMTNIHLA